jgi:hypothetical protein
MKDVVDDGLATRLDLVRVEVERFYYIVDGGINIGSFIKNARAVVSAAFYRLSE